MKVTRISLWICTGMCTTWKILLEVHVHVHVLINVLSSNLSVGIAFQPLTVAGERADQGTSEGG